VNLLRSISRRLAFGLVALLAVVAVVVVFPSSASAATTQKSSCKDKGKHLWKARTVWGAEYRDASGVKRIYNNAVGFTSAAPDATTVDYSVKGYDGAGKAPGIPARGAPPRSAPITPGTTPVRPRTPATVL